MNKDRTLVVVVSVVVVGVVILATRPRDKERPTETTATAQPDDDAAQRVGFANTATRSFADRPGAGFKLTANTRGPRNTVLVLDVTSETCTEQVLRQVELVMGSKNVTAAGFESIECADGNASIVP